VRDCPLSIISLKGDYPVISDEEKCLRCGHCLAVCPQGAISVLGHHPSSSSLLQGALPSAPHMETLIKGRRSVRHYKDKDVNPALIRELLDISSHAPTGTNSQKLLITVLDKRESLQAFRSEVYSRLSKLDTLNRLPDDNRANFFRMAVQFWKEEQCDLIFRNAPHLLLVSNATDASCVEQDPVIFLSYFELMAQTKGVGTVWCGLLYWVLKDMLPDLLPRLDIPDSYTLGYAMLFGYPAFSYYRTVERDTASVKIIDWK
jgi:nitroreductase